MFEPHWLFSTVNCSMLYSLVMHLISAHKQDHSLGLLEYLHGLYRVLLQNIRSATVFFVIYAVSVDIVPVDLYNRTYGLCRLYYRTSVQP